MSLLAALPFVSITIPAPAGEPATWSDDALITFIDHYDKEVNAGGELFAFTRSTELFFAAWIELHARTEGE